MTTAPSLLFLLAHNDPPAMLLLMLATGLVCGYTIALSLHSSWREIVVLVFVLANAGEIATGVGHMLTYGHIIYSLATLTYIPLWTLLAVGAGLGVRLRVRHELHKLGAGR